MNADHSRIAPLAYLRGLITRARAGDFTPEVALQIAEGRKRRHRVETVLRQAEAAHSETLKGDGLGAAHVSDSPLVRRLHAIRNRHCGSGSAE